MAIPTGGNTKKKNPYEGRPMAPRGPQGAGDQADEMAAYLALSEKDQYTPMDALHDTSDVFEKAAGDVTELPAVLEGLLGAFNSGATPLEMGEAAVGGAIEQWSDPMQYANEDPLWFGLDLLGGLGLADNAAMGLARNAAPAGRRLLAEEIGGGDIFDAWAALTRKPISDNQGQLTREGALMRDILGESPTLRGDMQPPTMSDEAASAIEARFRNIADTQREMQSFAGQMPRRTYDQDIYQSTITKGGEGGVVVPDRKTGELPYQQETFGAGRQWQELGRGDDTPHEWDYAATDFENQLAAPEARPTLAELVTMRSQGDIGQIGTDFGDWAYRIDSPESAESIRGGFDPAQSPTGKVYFSNDPYATYDLSDRATAQGAGGEFNMRRVPRELTTMEQPGEWVSDSFIGPENIWEFTNQGWRQLVEPEPQTTMESLVDELAAEGTPEGYGRFVPPGYRPETGLEDFMDRIMALISKGPLPY